MQLTRMMTVTLVTLASIVAAQCSGGSSSVSSPISPTPLTLSLPATSEPGDDTVSTRAVGDSTNSTAELGKVKVCKAGNVNGSFSVSGGGGTVTIVSSPTTVAVTTCKVFAEDSGTPGALPGTTGGSVTITETPTTGLQSVTMSRNDSGAISVGSFSNGGTLFLNNNHGYAITFTNTVVTPAQLVVAKTPDAGTFVQGAQVSFTIVVSNPAAAGAQSTSPVSLTDSLPSNGGLVWQTATTTAGTCVSPIVANSLSCSLGAIAPGASVTVTVTSTATTPAAACQSQPNPAAVATAGTLSAQNGGSLSCTPPAAVPGRMTGGGSVFTAAGDRVTHGFELHCDKADLPNNLEVNWGGNGRGSNNFHLDVVTSAVCTDNPAIAPRPPDAGFDTYVGTGTGTLNGVPGATITWTFTDAGEPGRLDTATITIKDQNGVTVLTVSGNLNSGNQQAHAK